MGGQDDVKTTVVSFWISVNEGEYDKVLELLGSDCTVRFPAWEGIYEGREACSKFFKKFVMDKTTTETDLSFFQGFHPAGEDDGSHRQIVNWINEEGVAKNGEKYKAQYVCKWDVTGVCITFSLLQSFYL